jgi:hypothetical protein
MELQGKWSKDEEGYMSFDSPQIQRYYEQITEQYHRICNRYEEEYDEDVAYLKVKEDGYAMITDYKIIDGQEEFATSFVSPEYLLDMWYETDPVSQKRDYTRGFIRITGKLGK